MPRGSCQLSLWMTRGDVDDAPASHGWTPYSRIWDLTISHCLKQWIWPRTSLCGGCGRRMALHSLELHARNNDDVTIPAWPRFRKYMALWVFALSFGHDWVAQDTPTRHSSYIYWYFEQTRFVYIKIFRDLICEIVKGKMTEKPKGVSHKCYLLLKKILEGTR